MVYAEFHWGYDGVDASAALQDELPLKWTVDHKGGGVAYLFLKCTYDRTAFSGLPTITAAVKGKVVGGVLSEDVFYSNNPAWCLFDYLSSTRYVRGTGPD